MVIRLPGRIAAVLAGTAASFFVAGPPASAQERPIVIQASPYLRIERVGYGDLNLATRAGEQSLHRRVSRAVERVCDYDPVRWYGLSEPDYNHCSWESWRRARPQMTGAIYRARLLAYGRGY